MSIVYYLQHLVRKAHSHRKGIGKYTTLHAAIDAIGRVKDKPGFKEAESGFSIFRCKVDQVYWPDGLDTKANLVDSSQLNPARDTLPVPVGNHVHLAFWDDPDTTNDFVLIGIFSSRALAENAIQDVKARKGAPAHGEYDISLDTLDRDNWVEGFISV